MKTTQFVLGDLEETIAPSDAGDPMLSWGALVIILLFLPGALVIRSFSAE